MSPAPGPSGPSQRALDALNHSLRRVHRSVLGMLAVAALVVVGMDAVGATAAPSEIDSAYPLAALLLAGGSILTRRRAVSPLGNPRRFVNQCLVSLALAAGLGVVAVVLAAREGQIQVALLYVLGGALLALRPPPRLLPRGGDGRSAGPDER